ncbi:LPS export ABC transporter permease LptF [Limibacillus sp. MBR-115]|jgi:lipopolysaccharide export system permease protein|uniref:LPS export ABC transporter permease LptF n=1 Tax=Limibacillus sp. MBR-115 TaxID=3156465 RepID=UPI0033985147
MTNLERHILRQLVFLTLVILLALTFAVWLSQSLRLIKLIVNQGIDIASFLYLIALLAPAFISIVMPLAGFAAVLVIYNKMANDSELVVMRAAGFSPLQIARPALYLGIVLTLANYLVAFYLQPASYRAFKDTRTLLQTELSAVLIEEGVFTDVTDGLTVYIRDRLDDGSLQGILVHDTRAQGKPVTMMADRGFIADADAGPKVVMLKGNRQEMNQETGQLALLYFDRYTLELTQLGKQLEMRWPDPAERYLSELVGPGIHPSDNDPQVRPRLTAEAHKRFASPFLSMTFILLALSALLSGDYNRRGQTNRLAVAVIIVGALDAASFGSHSLIEEDTFLAPLIYAISLLPALAAGFVLIAGIRGTTGKPLVSVPS